MTAEELTINIAVNLGRISRWATEGKRMRIEQFLKETEEYLHELGQVAMSDRFRPTYRRFYQQFNALRQSIQLNEIWAEDMLTWANILMHRAKLA